MSKRNMIWLVVVVIVGVLVAAIVSWVWGLLAAATTLLVSELLERTRRRRVRAAKGLTGAPSIKDAIGPRRRR